MWDGLWVALEGELVALEPLRADHAEELFAASRDPEIWRWLPIAAPTRAELEAWVAGSVAEGEAGREAPYATVWRRSARAIGSTRFLTLRPEHRSVEIGWTWLDSAAWATGANVEAKLLMLAHAFERLGCQRVEFKTDARNERSRAALAALPARFEGVLRRHMDMPYGPRDSAYYSVVADEWPAVRARLAARVSAKAARE